MSIELTDLHDYSALRYVVVYADPVAKEIVLRGLKKHLSRDVEARIEQHRKSRKLRKDYVRSYRSTSAHFRSDQG